MQCTIVTRSNKQRVVLLNGHDVLVWPVASDLIIQTYMGYAHYGTIYGWNGKIYSHTLKISLTLVRLNEMAGVGISGLCLLPDTKYKP